MFKNSTDYRFLKLIEQIGKNRNYRLLVVRNIDSQKEFTFLINRFVEVPNLRKYQLINLEIELFTSGKSKNNSVKIKKIEKKEAG